MGTRQTREATEMFAETGSMDQEASFLCRQQKQANLLIFLVFLVACLVPAAYAQEAGRTPVSPDDWLMTKAGVDAADLNQSNAATGKHKSGLKIRAKAIGEVDQAQAMALKFTDAVEIADLEDEIVGLYGEPSKQSRDRKVWNIQSASAHGNGSFVLTYQTLPNRDVVIRVETGGTAEPARTAAHGKL